MSRQTVNIARKYVADERIMVEVGDFSSAASMAASPIYQAAGLVQFGFSNSHPDFTKGGDYMWSNSIPQSDQQPLLAEYAAKLGLKTQELKDRLVKAGLVEYRDGKDYITQKGKDAGGEFRMSPKFGPYLLWPENLKI